MSFIPEGHLVPLNKTDLDRKALEKTNKQTKPQASYICGRANVSAYAGNLKVNDWGNIGKKSESNHETPETGFYSAFFKF